MVDTSDRAGFKLQTRLSDDFFLKRLLVLFKFSVNKKQVQ